MKQPTPHKFQDLPLYTTPNMMSYLSEIHLLSQSCLGSRLIQTYSRESNNYEPFTLTSCFPN